MLEVQDRARAKEKLASGSRRAIVWVPIVALGIATGIFFGRFYFVHELVLFVDHCGDPGVFRGESCGAWNCVSRSWT
jgi:hypothetical protein